MRSSAPLPVRVLTIAAAVLAMMVLIRLAGPSIRGLGPDTEDLRGADLGGPEVPIAAEALPYRTRPGRLAVSPFVDRRPQAQPRTMEIHRSLRAYPGAPPRIPHGLTEPEFRLTLCNSCHARGGFAPRFGTYTPVTPHAGWSDCLQCHAPDAMTVGLGLPRITDDVICQQCHVNPDEPPPSLVSLDWEPRAWPELGQRAMDESPQWIPHTLQYRENCMACHGGPWAVEGIRTTHPERVDCRACHVTVEEARTAGEEAFTRPLDGRGAREGREE
jgi:hypothetical protein